MNGAVAPDHTSVVSSPEDSEQVALLALSRIEGLGCVRWRSLLSAFGSAANIFGASARRLAEVDQIGPKTADAILARTPTAEDQHEWGLCRAGGVALQFLDVSPHYPAWLAELPQAPLRLSVWGDTVFDRRSVALVGSRDCSSYGSRMASVLAKELALRGITVVSGLARGIDLAAHRAALDAGGRTVGVMASGLARVYPPEHKMLAREISQHGSVVSEALLDGPPIGDLFPKRNRIISGLCVGVVVVEAAERSGALSTAFHALEQNRDVFAVPGRVGDPMAGGTNKLIRDGAYLVRSIEDILEVLGPAFDVAPAPVRSVQPEPDLFAAADPTEMVLPTRPARRERRKTKQSSEKSEENRQTPVAEPPSAPPPEVGTRERAVWDCLDASPRDTEQLAEALGWTPAEISSLLLVMELGGTVVREPGARYRRG